MFPATIWLIFSTMIYTLRLDSGSSFPKPLTAEEERHYVALAAQGDLDARNILIERNLRLVAHIMKKYYAHTSDQEDLISIGTIGLIKGISSFDPSKGARLATYAARCVENATLSPTRQTAEPALRLEGGRKRNTQPFYHKKDRSHWPGKIPGAVRAISHPVHILWDRLC